MVPGLHVLNVVGVAPDHDSTVSRLSEGSFYHSSAWLHLVCVVTNSELRCFYATDLEDRVVAVMPVFEKDGAVGRVLNSSAYFGSHGGILADSKEGFRTLADFFTRYVASVDARTATIIEPLFRAGHANYPSAISVHHQDMRLGQFKNLEGLETREALLASLGGLVRSNLKRRAWKTAHEIARDESTDAMSWLYRLHAAEMTSRPDGKPKSPTFFKTIQETMTPGKEYRLYIAKERSGSPLAGLLLLYWKDTVEYITPVFEPRARRDQLLSSVIFEAMLDAAKEGYRIWNFGGTWPSQSGLRAFKESWGCDSQTYRYHVLDTPHLPGFMREDRKMLAREYDGFYLFNFNLSENDFRSGASPVPARGPKS